MDATPQQQQDHDLGTHTMEEDPSLNTSLRAFSASDVDYSNAEFTTSGSTGQALRQPFGSSPVLVNGLQTSSPSPHHPTGLPLASKAAQEDEEDPFMFSRDPVPPPPPEAPNEEHLEFIHYQLDCLTEASGVVLYGLIMLGDRLQGGQAVVQMARHKHSAEEYAIKFFAKKADFDGESALYLNQASALFSFLPKPKAVVDNLDGEFVDPSGHPLPPCIVMERGESLDIWSQRAQPDRSQAFTMMYHLAMHLKALHENGYAHRDLKPGNVMWQPSRNLWTLIDFGCAARIGTMHDVALTVAYAAPEVVAEYRKGSKKILVHEAVDAWSLGVVAFELLTGEPAAKLWVGREKVMDRIQGKGGQKLPWEGTPMKPRLKKKLGMFRKLVLGLLNRDPSKRPTMKRFCSACHHLMSATVTVQVRGRGSGGGEVGDVYEDCYDEIISEHSMETAASQMSPAPTGMQELPCGCEMLAVVAMELLKVGMCSKCGHRFPPSLAAAESHLSERTLTSSARDFDGSNGLDTAHENGLHTTMRPEAITDLKQLSDCLTLTACIPDLSLDDRTLALPRGASRIFSETAAEWEGVEMWPLHADPSERNIREGLFSLGVMRHVGGECVVCLAGSGVTLRGGVLDLGGELNAALLLDFRSDSFLQNITVKGGLLVLYGSSCSVTLKQCTLEQCTVVVLAGAKVTLESSSLMSNLISVYASGRGTIVKATARTTITGGMQGVSINDGASFEATALTVSNFSATGIEARGISASLMLSNCNLLEASMESSMPSSVHRGARGVLVHEHAKAILLDLCIENAWAGIWAASGARIEASACMIGPCERYGAFAEGGSGVLLQTCEIAGIASGDGMHVTGKGTVGTGDHCRFERASAAGASARDGARLKLKYCQAEVNGVHGFLAKRGAAVKAVGCESNSDGVGVCADSEAHIIAVSMTVLNGRHGGIVATGGAVLKLLEASVAGCSAGAGVRVSDANTDLEMWGGTVVHRTSNAAVDVTTAANAKMQGVSVSAGTGPAFRVTDAKSRLNLVSCNGFVAARGEIAPHSEHQHSINSQLDGQRRGYGGSTDSQRVYSRKGGGQIRAFDCQPELDPKPKASKYPQMVPSAIQQSRGPQHATGIVYTNTALPSSAPVDTPHYPAQPHPAHLDSTPNAAVHATYAWGGPPPGSQAHAAQQAQQGGPAPVVPWWYNNNSLPEDAAAPDHAVHVAHAGHVQPDFAVQGGGAQQPINKKKKKKLDKMRSWLSKFVGSTAPKGARGLHLEPGSQGDLLSFSDELDSHTPTAFPLDPGNPYATTPATTPAPFSPQPLANPPEIQRSGDYEGGDSCWRYPDHNPSMHARMPKHAAESDDEEEPAGDDMEGSGRLDATSDTSSDSSGATAELNGHAAPDTYSEELRAKELQAMLQFVRDSPDSQLPIEGSHFLYTSQPLPSPAHTPSATAAQGCVTTLAHCTDASLQVALTFYLRPSLLDTQEELWSHPKLQGSVLQPLTVERNESGHWRSAAGAALPPYTITARGGLQSLGQWANSQKPAFTACVKVMCGVVSKLAALHAAGYVHHRMTVSSIVRSSEEDASKTGAGRWLLRDLNCVARIGSTAALPLKSELSQCSPPEMILAATSAAARASAPVDTATDIWAVGIMLLELLTGRCAQTGMHAAAPVDTDVVAAPVDTVLAPAALAKLRATASGKAAFSWEPGARGSVALLGRLRGLKGMVLKCLSRDAAARPSAKKLLQVLGTFTAEQTVEEVQDSDDDDADDDNL